MTGKLAFVHKQDLQINKLCDCRCKVSGTVPQKSRTKRCEFIENSTELNRQKSCKNRIHSWSHAPLSLCTIYCSHQVRGGLVAVVGGGAFSRSARRHTAVHFVLADVLILCRPGSTTRPRGGVRLQLHRHVLAGDQPAARSSMEHIMWRAWRCFAPPRRVSRPQKKAQI